MKGTRNTDPFSYGISGLYEGNMLEGFFENNIREKNLKGRIYQTINDDKIKKVIVYIRKRGIVPLREITKKFDMEALQIKYLLTYRCPVYETDDGLYLGMLQKNGEPYPEREIDVKHSYEVHYEGEIKKFVFLKDAAKYIGVSHNTAATMMKNGYSKDPLLAGMKVVKIG